MTGRALISGITGQDGSYLADLLLARDYAVHGLVRRTATGNLRNVAHLDGRVTLHRGDLTDPLSVHRVIDEVRPHELYHEADQDSVAWSYATPAQSMDVTAGAACRLLESVRRIDPAIRVFQPCSATMFGDSPAPQTEDTPPNPQSPYAIAKTAAYYTARHYRREHGMFVATAILYNHVSPRQTDDYLLHKICKAAVKIKSGEQKELLLGDLEQVVDVGWAPEYVEAIHAIMQLEKPDDFVIASAGGGWRIADIVKEAGIPADRVRIDPAFRRPGNPPTLVGDSLKAFRAFGYRPRMFLHDIVARLVDHYREQA